MTGFDVDFCFRMIMSTYHHAATFEGLADEFNDLHCKGISFAILCNYPDHVGSSSTFKSTYFVCADYESVDDQRLKINKQRVADALNTFTFLELNER